MQHMFVKPCLVLAPPRLSNQGLEQQHLYSIVSLISPANNEAVDQQIHRAQMYQAMDSSRDIVRPKQHYDKNVMKLCLAHCSEICCRNEHFHDKLHILALIKSPRIAN